MVLPLPLPQPIGLRGIWYTEYRSERKVYIVQTDFLLWQTTLGCA